MTDTPNKTDPEAAASAEATEAAESAAVTETPAEAAVEAAESADEAASLPEAPAEPPKKRRFAALLAIPAALILAVIVCIVLCILPLTVEVGGTVTLSPMHALCSVVTDVHAIDTSVPGEHPLEVRLFGILPLKGTIAVVDRIPPVLTLHDLSVMPGITLSPADFVDTASDATPLTLTFAAEPDTASDGRVTVIAEDAGGNTTTAEAAFTVDDALSGAVFELGVSMDGIHDAMQTLHRFETVELDTVNPAAVGIYPVRGVFEGRLCLFTVEIHDTIAPAATVNSFDILLGQTLAIEDFVTGIIDESDVTAEYVTAPDFEKTGRQQLEILLTDASGNTLTCRPQMNIHNVQKSLVLEAGTPTADYLASVKALLGTGSAFPRMADGFETDYLPIGSYETSLIGEFSTIPLEIIIVDTVAPVMELRDVTVYTGDSPDASDFVLTCSDHSYVSFTFGESFDVSSESDRTLTIIARDAAGNETKGTAILHVTKNRVPPVIYGVRDLSAYEGETVSYRQGIYAEDDRDGTVSVKIDASRVKTSKAGTYYVTYTATDSDGNVGTATARVTINAINMYAVYPYADQILSQITASYMSDRQKASAIYDWCTSNLKYSTSTSHLMGYFAKAAYSGFRVKYGNCYTYYAVASALLTRAGISNIEIQRDDPDNPHYWNLVNIDGDWYHFDTCPQPSPHKLKVCLLTDSQLADFTKPGYYSFNSNLYPATP